MGTTEPVRSRASSRSAIRTALLANLGIAVAKFIGFVFTRSTAMLAETIHSLADTGNQALLFVGERGARRSPDGEHPFGYGGVRYFWAFIVALVLFSMGGLFSLIEGVEKLLVPVPLESPAWAFAILGVALLLEGWSLRTAVARARPVLRGRSWWVFIQQAKNPDLPVVLLEDSAALIGLGFAFAGVVGATVTGEPRWDAAGSIAIGLLLMTTASVLAVQIKSLLIGEAASPAEVDAIIAAIEQDGAVERVVELRTQHIGPEQILVVGRVLLSAGIESSRLDACIAAASGRVRQVVPTTRWVYLEPTVRA